MVIKRRTVRLHEPLGISEKKFRRVVQTEKKVDLAKIGGHPLIVVADLRRGSLKSLSKYLKQEGGIPHRMVAQELYKLLAGKRTRTRYRLAVIDHPDLPPRKGGRPTKQAGAAPTRLQHEVSSAFADALAEYGNVLAAEKKVAQSKKVSEAFVRRARKAVAESERSEKARLEAADADQRRWAEFREKRERALAALRAARSKRET